MTENNDNEPLDEQSDFDREASKSEVGLLQEFMYLLIENKKWWLVPLIGSLLLLGLISLMTAGGAAPFIYTLF